MSDPSPACIAVAAVRKTYRVAERNPGFVGALAGLVRRTTRELAALDGVSCRIARGELVGVLGPNGAGKSTLIKILCGILRPDGGTVTVAGRVPWRERGAHVAGIGAVFGQRSQLWWDLPAGESFAILGGIYRVDPASLRRRLDDLAALLDLGPILARPVRTLSLGQRMRCELAAALLHEPGVLFLDEPTIGLDAPAKLAVRGFIRERNRRAGTTVVLTSHDLDDVEALCPRVLVIAQGRLLLDGPFSDLRGRVGTVKRVTVDLSADAEPPALEGLVLSERQARRWVFAVDPARLPTAALLARLAQAPVADLSIVDEPIDHVIARLYAQVA